MKYVGGKYKLSQSLLPIILKHRKPWQYYVEPFCGGCNVIYKVKNPRIANDIHPQLIAMWKALCDGWQPPMLYEENFYKHVMANRQQYPAYLVGYVGFCSFGGKYFGGFPKDNKSKRDFLREYHNGMMKQIEFLKGIIWKNQNYLTLDIPENSVVYADPPYENTLDYKIKFDSKVFWGWCREIVSKGHLLYVSEYKAPSDFICIFQRKVTGGFSNADFTKKKRALEKLFVHKSQGMI
jgi:DNA adenine methylase